MCRHTFISILLLLLVGFQTTSAQGIKIWQNGEYTYFKFSEMDSIQFSRDKFVDLGLPSGTIWATCNVGASNPEEYGDYFAWGETTPKENYTWRTYRHCEVQDYSPFMTKYCMKSDYGTIDGLTEIEPEDDAATAILGNEWQTPSDEQWSELFNSKYTSNTWTTQNDINGILIISKSNGNSIFLPAAGRYSDANLSRADEKGYYWSRTLYTYYSKSALCLCFGSQSFNKNDDESRYYGQSIRPVRASSQPSERLVTIMVLSDESLNLQVGDTRQLTATVYPANADNPTVTWESSNNDVAQVSSEGLVTILATGICTITCRTTDGSGIYAECRVSVDDPNSCGTTDGHEWVNLGLPSGTLWATCNVGASSPEEFGNYFAWGETNKKEDYSSETYRYYDVSIIKYCDNSFFGTVDNKSELEPMDDAATANWSSEWQMPSEAQFGELMNSSYTSTSSTYLNNVWGLEITSNRNGNSIFLPYAGYYDGTNLNSSRGYYWSRTLSSTMPSWACCLIGSETYDYYNRYMGMPVRPVRVQK